ncbi:MAG: VOC family protein [Candidatus Dormibacteria bacterium]
MQVSQPFGKQPGWDWQVMADPEGNEFCVCREKSSGG